MTELNIVDNKEIRFCLSPEKFKHHNEHQQEANKQSIINALDKYIKKIESHSKENQPDFSHGFLFFKQSRAINREANYLLAKKLHSDLSNGQSMTETFSEITKQRDTVIADKRLFNKSNYVHRDIHSSELNNIIKKAEKIVSETETDTADNQHTSSNFYQ